MEEKQKMDENVHPIDYSKASTSKYVEENKPNTKAPEEKKSEKDKVGEVLESNVEGLEASNAAAQKKERDDDDDEEEEEGEPTVVVTAPPWPIEPPAPPPEAAAAAAVPVPVAFDYDVFPFLEEIGESEGDASSEEEEDSPPASPPPANAPLNLCLGPPKRPAPEPATEAPQPKTRRPEDVAAGRVGVVCALLAAGANVSVRDSQGWTPLHLAALNGHADCVAMLLAAGAQIDPATVEGRTPLHHAALEGREGCVRLLLEMGASVNAKDNAGKTPKDLAKDDATRHLFP